MNGLTDQQLLRDYTARRSETAFGELVRRHVDFVYSAALRMVRDAHLAEDVSQGVFMSLAQNAPQLTDRPVLSGWLHRTTQNLAANAVRSDVRRRAREQEVAISESLSVESDDAWEHIAPHLDAALGELSEADRDALTLRYFESKSAREMAQILGTTDDAAQKRVNRAVDRLREFFAKRGIAVGAGGLATAISANAVQAAPVGLATSISTVTALAGIPMHISTAIAATKTIAMTTMQKSLIAAATTVILGVGIYEGRHICDLGAQIQSLQQRQATWARETEQLRRDRSEAANRLAEMQAENERLRQASAELAKLRGQLTQLRNTAGESAKMGSEVGDSGELRFWSAKVRTFKERLDQMPERKIPELKLLKEWDWLEVTKEANLETEASARRAFSALRERSKREFAEMLREAFQKYANANNDQLPANLGDLRAYFESSVGDDILQRYSYVPKTGKWSEVDGQEVLVDENAPQVDFSDSRIHIGRDIININYDGFLPDDTLLRVFDEFFAGDYTREPKGFSQLEPYLKTAQEHEALKKLLLKEERDSSIKSTTDEK